MQILFKLTKFLFFIVLWINYTASASSEVSSTVLEQAKKAIVTINSRVAVSAYRNVGSWTGTGFITDKSGFIVTNAHVVGRASIGSYFITFYNGQQSEAKLAYYDMWQDYAILMVAQQDIPAEATQISFAKTPPKQNESVLVVGNTEGQDFSFHTGYVSGLYEINGEMPQCSYVINLNSAGGASGSPVLNKKNEAIGVLYGGGKTYIFALNGAYVQHALTTLKDGMTPVRKHCGIITELHSLDKAVKHRNFPKGEMEAFLKTFPDARNRAVSIRNLIAGSPAEGILQAGDIIWEINGKPLGGSLAVLDQAMDNAKTDTVKLVIYRDGQRIEKTVPLYDVNHNKIEKMINFAGATFFEADDFTSAKTGIPLHAVSIMNVQTGSSFSSIPVSFTQDDRNFYRLVVNIIAGKKIANLNDLITYIPEITKQKFINVQFKNYQPYFPSFQSNDASFISSQEQLIGDITFDTIDAKPRILKYNASEKEWNAEDIKM